MKRKAIKILLYVVLLLCVLGCIAGNIFIFNRTSSEIDALYNIVDSLHDDFVIEQKETITGKSKTCIIIDYEESENTTDAPNNNSETATESSMPQSTPTVAPTAKPTATPKPKEKSTVINITNDTITITFNNVSFKDAFGITDEMLKKEKELCEAVGYKYNETLLNNGIVEFNEKNYKITGSYTLSDNLPQIKITDKNIAQSLRYELLSANDPENYYPRFSIGGFSFRYGKKTSYIHVESVRVGHYPSGLISYSIAIGSVPTYIPCEVQF